MIKIGSTVWAIEADTAGQYKVLDIRTGGGSPYEPTLHGEDCYLLLDLRQNSWFPRREIFVSKEAAVQQLLQAEFLLSQLAIPSGA